MTSVHGRIGSDDSEDPTPLLLLALSLRAAEAVAFLERSGKAGPVSEPTREDAVALAQLGVWSLARAVQRASAEAFPAVARVAPASTERQPTAHLRELLR